MNGTDKGVTRIALDAMGGDLAPVATVGGALRANRELGIEVCLVGPRDLLHRELESQGWKGGPGIEVVDAPDVVTMSDPPRVVFRRKQRASVRVGAALLREGRAAGLVSAGNTGAVMASMMLELGKLEGVDRPAIALMFPTSNGHAVVLDVGANVDCRPQHLEQFAAMGTVYYRAVFNEPNPRVGLLNIGEEEGKGNELVKEAHTLLKGSALNFVGNVEAKDVFHDRVDVIVCDGFIGNVLLKVSENLALTFGHFLEEAIQASWLASAGFVLAKRAVKTFMKRIDYTEFGGLPLLGTKGVGIICHGRSDVKVLKNALRAATEFHRARINEAIERLLPELHAEGRSAPMEAAGGLRDTPAAGPEA